MVDLKQTFYFYDYFGFLAVGAVFAAVLLLLSFFLINFLLVQKDDELTIFEKFGSRHNVRLGPHSLDSIKQMRERRKIIDEEERHQAEEKLNKQKGIVTQAHPKQPVIPHVQVDAASTS